MLNYYFNALLHIRTSINYMYTNIYKLTDTIIFNLSEYHSVIWIRIVKRQSKNNIQF